MQLYRATQSALTPKVSQKATDSLFIFRVCIAFEKAVKDDNDTAEAVS